MKIVVVGGAGAMGRITTRDLAELWPEAETVVADFDRSKAEELCAELGGKLKPTFVDVTSERSMGDCFRDAFAVINGAPYRFNVAVMKASLGAGAHYLDLGGLFHVTRKQMELDEAFRREGRLALLGIGAAPGISNLLAEVGAERLDEVKEIHVRLGSSDTSKYKDVPALPVSYSLQTILEEFSMPPAVFTKGDFRFVEPMSGALPHRFPAPVGVRRPFFTLHSEVATLPLSYRSRGVREVSFKIAFDDEFVDRVRFLRDMGFASHERINVGGCEVRPIEVVNRVAMAQRKAVRVGALRQHEVVRTVVKGTARGKKKTIIADCHTTGMPKWNVGTDVNTGCPPAVAARMLAEGEITALGALPPEKAIPPKAFFARLKKRGMRMTTREVSGWGFPV